MDTTKPAERRQDSRQQYARLDERYGKIGISAVAAAMRHKSEPRKLREIRPDTAYDRD